LAEDRARVLAEQQQLLEDNQRVSSLVLDEILNVAHNRELGTVQQREAILDALGKLDALSPQVRATAYLRVGNILVGMNQYDAALSAYDSGLKLDPKDRRLFAGRADLYYQQGRDALALSDYIQAIDDQHPHLNDPAQQRALRLRRAIMYCRQGQFGLATADLELLNAQSPSLTINELAKVFDGVGATSAIPDPRLAPHILDLLQGTVEESRKTINTRRDRAMLLAEFGHFGMAQEEFEHIAASVDAAANDAFFGAVVAAAAGDKAAYQRFCARQIRRNGSALNVFTPWCCAIAPDALDNYEHAIEVAGEIAQQMPKSGACQMALGAILYRSGNIEDGQKVLQAAVKMKRMPADPGLNTTYGPYLLAMADFRLGKQQEAKNHLRDGNILADRVLSVPGNWRQRVTMQMLRREATSIVGGSVEPAAPTNTTN
jgi:tetratricopeptide (TPR) repeat protein